MSFVLLPRAASLRHPGGLARVAAGTALRLACVREFHVAGRQALAPWAPPGHRVAGGAYRFSPNPMYVAVTRVIAGWAILFGSARLWTYGAGVALLFELRVLLFEEPWLARSFGADWDRYRERVPRGFI